MDVAKTHVTPSRDAYFLHNKPTSSMGHENDGYLVRRPLDASLVKRDDEILSHRSDRRCIWLSVRKNGCVGDLRRQKFPEPANSLLKIAVSRGSHVVRVPVLTR